MDSYFCHVVQYLYNMSQARIPIRTVAALTGVNPITLRAWERRYGLVRPLRTPKGHRLYTQAHVAEIRRVLALTRSTCRYTFDRDIGGSLFRTLASVVLVQLV